MGVMFSAEGAVPGVEFLATDKIGWDATLAVLATGKEWQALTPAHFDSLWMSAPRTNFIAASQIPSTLLFKTGEGRRGILQFSELLKDPARVRLRYSLLAEAASAVQPKPRRFDEGKGWRFRSTQEVVLDSAPGGRRFFDPIANQVRNYGGPDNDSLIEVIRQDSGELFLRFQEVHAYEVPRAEEQRFWQEMTTDEFIKMSNNMFGTLPFERNGMVPLRPAELPRMLWMPGLGLLHVWAITDDAPPRVQIRYKLVDPESATALAPAGAKTMPGFGPVIARVLPVNGLGYSDTLDLDLGTIVATPMPQPPLTWTSVDLPAGIMVIPVTEASPTVVVATAAAIAPLPPGDEYWNGSIGLADAKGMAGSTVVESQTVQASGFDNPPHNFMFKTKGGKTGLLQVTGFTENPRGVQVRYKLLRDDAGEADSTPTDSPENGQAGRAIRGEYKVTLTNGVVAEVTAVVLQPRGKAEWLRRTARPCPPPSAACSAIPGTSLNLPIRTAKSR
jgi:hypothetical protein